MKSKNAPIVLFVYNRLEHTRLTIQSLLKNPESSESILYIFADGPKHAADMDAVNSVRDYVEGITGFEEVIVIGHETNKGLAESVIEGVSQVCERHGRVIVLEDDLHLSPSFLTYMNNSLRRYENEDQVMQIAGYMFPGQLSTSRDAIFLPFISSWGWATWQRAWEKFDPDASHFRELQADPQKIATFNLNNHYDYFSMLSKQQAGKVNSWAIRWYLTVFFCGGLVLYPRKSLVENLGFDSTGENCLVSEIATENIDESFTVRTFPQQVAPYAHMDEVYALLPRPKKTLAMVMAYCKRRISSWFH